VCEGEKKKKGEKKKREVKERVCGEREKKRVKWGERG
jgi:hypothetical protein